MAKTRYVVLEEVSGENGGVDYWSIYDVGVEASSSDSALRAALKDRGNLGSRYVAIPERSWKPQSVSVKTEHRLKIG